MNINGYEDLKDLSQGIADDTQGEMSTHLGNNVNAPLDDGLGMYNRAVNDLFTYGDHQVSMNEGVEYAYDIKPIYDNLDKITAVLRAQLKKINARETEANKDFKADPRIDTSMGFLKGLKDDEGGDFGAIKAAMNDAKHPPSLSTDIKIKDKTKFLNVLRQIFKDLPPDQLKSLISSASGFISTFDIESVRQFIGKVESEVEQGNFYNGDINKESREQAIQLLVGKLMRKLLNSAEDDVIANDPEAAIESAINNYLPEILRNVSNEWIEKDMKEVADKPNTGEIAKISIREVRDAMNKEFAAGGVDMNVLQNLYNTGKKLSKRNKPAYTRPAEPTAAPEPVDKSNLNIPTYKRNEA